MEESQRSVARSKPLAKAFTCQMAASNGQKNCALTLQQTRIPVSQTSLSKKKIASDHGFNLNPSFQQLPPPLTPSPTYHLPPPTPVLPKSAELKHTIHHYGKDASDFERGKFIWDHWERGSGNIVGTAAYYKSWTFRTKKQEGTVQIPGCSFTAVADASDDDLDAVDTDMAEPPKPKSLVIIMSRTNVRRASAKRAVHIRMQRHNKRM